MTPPILLLLLLLLIIPSPLVDRQFFGERAVLASRWPQVQATAAALLVGGTLDGVSLCALLEQLERARPASPLLYGACWAWAERRRLREAHALVLEPR